MWLCSGRGFFSSPCRPWWVRQCLHLHRRWSHRIWWRVRSRHSCGVHLWCSWGYNLPVNSLFYYSSKKSVNPSWISLKMTHRIWLLLSPVTFDSIVSPPFSSMTLLFRHRFSRTQWKLLTIIGNWKALKTSKRTSNWWATLRVTSQNVRICTVMITCSNLCFTVAFQHNCSCLHIKQLQQRPGSDCLI